MPKGLDATFAEGSINFRFKNTTGKSLLIRAYVEGNNLTVKFFGTFPKNTEYELETRTVETLPVKEKFVQNKDIPAGAQEVLQEGKPGYVVETYQIKKVNGETVEKKRVSRDTYRPQSRLIAVNNGSAEIAAAIPRAPKSRSSKTESAARISRKRGACNTKGGPSPKAKRPPSHLIWTNRRMLLKLSVHPIAL